MGGESAGLTLAGGTVPHGALTRAQIILRAQSWLGEHVPYSQTSWWTDANGSYRQDCSGYVSMAWALPQALDFWTGNLASVSHPIAAADLKPGDVLLNEVHHVVIFAGWADAAHTLFNLYEEAHTGTDARYVVDAPIDGYLADAFVPYRYDGVIDSMALPAAPAHGTVFGTLGAKEYDPSGVQHAPNLGIPAGKLAALEQRAYPFTRPASSTTAKGRSTIADTAGLAAAGDETASLAAGVSLSATLAGLLVGGVLYGRRPVGRRRR
jgi:hypothetical protein